MRRTLPLADATPQPWRNGGGLTRELLAWPEATAWQLRVSVAEIAQDGPFSAFPGVTRSFAVLSGAGVMLGFAGRELRCVPDGRVLTFDGAAAPGCRLIDGATSDLNLMSRDDAGRASMQPVVPGAWRSNAPLRGLFSAGAGKLRVDGAPAAQLAAAGLIVADGAAGQAWQWHAHDGATLAWWLSFQPHTA